MLTLHINTRVVFRYKADLSKKDMSGNTVMHDIVEQIAKEPTHTDSLLKANTTIQC